MSGVAVVTGAGRNLGRAIVLALARDGFDVVVNTRSDLPAAENVAKEAAAFGVRAVAFRADVTEPTEVEALFEGAAEIGPVRVLVNNAALRTRVPVERLTFEAWRALHDVTLDGAFRCVQRALPLLRAAGEGRIITVLGANALAGDPTRVHLSAAKHGLVGMTLALAHACPELAVNAVSPGRMHGAGAEEADRRRAGVAETIAFLASAAAQDVTGQVVEVGPRGPG